MSPVCTCRRKFGASLLAPFIAPIAGLFASAAHAQRSVKSHVLDTGADVLQKKRPVDAMSSYLNGFHFYADNVGRQVEAHHFCTHLSEDFHQCVIYDGNLADSKLIGIEYILSARVFQTLPEDEKQLWHSHDYEVRSGELIAPNVPDVAEHALMADLVSTYGKTWHTWQIDRYPELPQGIPQLMMGFTRDGQVSAELIDARDQRMRVSAVAQRSDRSDIAGPQVDPGANAWQSGKTLQLKLFDVSVNNLPR
jgi:hypothetical protein